MFLASKIISSRVMRPEININTPTRTIPSQRPSAILGRSCVRVTIIHRSQEERAPRRRVDGVTRIHLVAAILIGAPANVALEDVVGRPDDIHAQCLPLRLQRDVELAP